MRFYLKEEAKPGDTRVRRFFAFWPVRIGHEVRWLERVTIKELAIGDYIFGGIEHWSKQEFLVDPYNVFG